ncbi:unnamed protein product, partial [Iphiclides podalirius]
MEKKIAKTQEQTDKNIENRKDRGDSPRRIKHKFDKPNPIDSLANKKVLHDRGDSKKAKFEETQIKYDATKLNKAVEANPKSIKQTISVASKNGIQPKRNDQKSPSNSTDFALHDDKPKTWTNSKLADGRATCGKKTLEKVEGSSRQTSDVKSDHEAGNGARQGGANRRKVKEVITIPYMPADDPPCQETDNEPAPVTEPKTKPRNVAARHKAVTFKEQGEMSPNRQRTVPRGPRTRHVEAARTKAQNPPKQKRRRKPNSSPSPIKGAINESQPTEVVKWSPSCLSSQTRPYYEAWVDTSLTAVSRCSERERLRLEREMETLQRSWRPVTPELLYERHDDESYTGRIRVRLG